MKITSANTLLVVVRMGFSLITQKALAILIGAEGIAIVGNFKNVINFFEQFSILGTANGLVKYISKHRNNKQELNYLFSTAFIFAALAIIISFVILFFWSDTLNNFVFGSDKSYGYIFKILSVVIPCMGVNAIFNSVLNGLSHYKLFSKTALITIIISTLLIICFTYQYGVDGSLVAISIIPIVHFLIQILFFSNYYKNYIKIKKLLFDLSYKNKLLSYSIMTITVVLFINATDVAIRNLIEKNISIEDAGYWTAMTSISKTYMQFTATIFPLYILPRYAKITDTFEFRDEIKRIYKLLLPLILIGMLLVFIFRNLIIQVLFTQDFLVMSNLFKWQLLGDFFKFIAFVLAYQFLAKRQIGYYIFIELLSVILFYVFSFYFIDIYGTEGVVLAHFARYVLYLVVVLFILRKNFIGENRTF